MTVEISERWTAVAGYVDARGVVVGFLLEAQDGRRLQLSLVEPEGEVRELTIEELQSGELAGEIRA